MFQIGYIILGVTIIIGTKEDENFILEYIKKGG